MRRGRDQGFTLIEAMVVVAVITILTTLAYSSSRNGLVNANVSSAVNELAMRVSGLRAAAMAENRDYVLVVADAKDNDATRCSRMAPERCLQLFVLKSPEAAWTLAGFDPASPATNASFLESLAFGRAVSLDLASAPARPAPFDGIPLRDAELTSTCSTGRKCFALRFRAGGAVLPEYASGTNRKLGYAFAVGPSGGNGNERRLLVVSFPTGIVKSVAF